MRIAAFAILAALAGLNALAANAGPITDHRGVALDIDLPAQRIVSLAPHLTELLFAIDAGRQVVGTSEYSDWPPAAEDVPRIGDAYRFDLERIVALQPDVVLAWKSGTPEGVIEQLERLGLPVAVIATPDIQAVAGNLRWLGELSGKEGAAEAAASEFLADLAAIRVANADKKSLSVFYQISAQPLFTVNGDHSISSVIEMCGGENIFAGLDSLAPTVSREAVVARNPDVITGGAEAVAVDGATSWQNWPRLKAVRYDNVIPIDAVLLARPTPRIVEGARELCAALDGARERISGSTGTGKD